MVGHVGAELGVVDLLGRVLVVAEGAYTKKIHAYMHTIRERCVCMCVCVWSESVSGWLFVWRGAHPPTCPHYDKQTTHTRTAVDVHVLQHAEQVTGLPQLRRQRRGVVLHDDGPWN